MMKNFLFLISSIFVSSLNATPVSNEHILILNKALNKAFGVSQANSVEPLTGGFSSPGLYKIVVKGKSYVARFSVAERSVADRQRELDAMRKAAKRGLAPKVLYGNVEDGIIVMELIDNQRPTREEVLSDKNLKTLAKQIRKIHDGPKFGEFYTPFQIARHFVSTLPKDKPQIVTEALNLLNDLEKSLQDKLVKKPCHNDLNPNNILYSHGKIKFVDWEGACQADPYFDIATILTFYHMNTSQNCLFLKTYFGHQPSVAEKSKLQTIQRVTMLYYGFGMLMLSHKMGAKFLNPEEIAALPRLGELYSIKGGANLLKTPKDMEEFGFVLLREAINLTEKIDV